LNGLETAPDAAHQAIIMLLGRLDDDRALPVLRELLASDDTAVVALGVEAWARLWPRHQDLQPLLEVLGHPSPVVRQVAATAIGGLLDDSVAEQLHARLEGATVLERESITRILGQASGEHAALLTALHDPETSVRRIAIAMLARRVGSNGAAAAAVGDVLQSGPPSVRAAAAHALALAPDSFARPLLLEALRDEDGWTRMQVCKSLARLGHDDDAERIAALQHDPGPYVRAAVAEALGILHGAVVVPTLIDLVRDPVADVQAAARAALATHGSPEARRVLESLDGTTSSP
jgi:HEAT repeat protein